MRRVVAAALTMVLLSACQSTTTELTERQKAEIEESVKRAASEYIDLWFAQDDMEAYMSRHSDWAGTPWGFGSLNALRSYTEQYWERWDFEVGEAGEMEVMVLGPDAAAVNWTTTYVRIDTAGDRQERTVSFAHVWVREDGQWQLLLAKQA